MSARRIAVLGCGPAGLLAAHAVTQAGHVPVVYSLKKKSLMPGTMYVHEPIEGVTESEPDGCVTITHEGTRDGYARKVYGREDAPVSWDTFTPERYRAWSMAKLYDRLWDMYGEAVRNCDVRDIDLDFLQRSSELVISAIPMRALCYNQFHFFNGTQIWITEEAWRDCPEDTIIYNGEDHVPWYRTSRIFGHGALESTVKMPGCFSGVKPLSTNCDCYPEIKRVGRFGQWKKGVLVHHAYHQTLEELGWRGAANVV